MLKPLDLPSLENSPAPAMPAPSAPHTPITTAVPPAGLNCRRIDVAKLIEEINADLTRLNGELVAAQAGTAAAHEAYSALVAGSDRIYNDLLTRQGLERAAAFGVNAKAIDEARTLWQAAAAKQKAAEDEIGGEIKYVVGLVSGDPLAAQPKLRENPRE